MTRRNILLAVMIFLSCSPLLGAPSADRPRRATTSVYNYPGGTGPANWQWGKQLFWEHADTADLGSARRAANTLALSGVAPVMSAVGWIGAVRWGDTTLDTSVAFQWRDPAWVAYTFWTYAHDSLTAIGPNGQYLASFDEPSNSLWIPFNIPLDSQDCPNGMKRCTYGDFAADRIGRLCVRTNLAGLYAADFVDGLPGGILTQYSFHPRILEAFSDSTGISLPEGSVSAKADAILKQYMPEWADFWADAWGRFYADVAAHVRKAGRLQPLACAQTAWNVNERRLMAVDFRRYIRYMPGENWFFSAELQGDNMRAMKPLSTQTTLFGTYAAWEPDMPMGAKLNVVDNFLYDAMLIAGMDTAHAQAVQRSQYLQAGFTHIATRAGNVRRAAQAFEYGYYDNLEQADALSTDFLLQHFPRRPHGPGFYYSQPQMRSYERELRPFYLIEQADSLWNIAPFGFYMTDASLDSLAPLARPTAWLVPSPSRLPDSERRKLSAIAPILDADSAAKTSPIRATGKGRAWGFWDQDSALVVLVSNPDSVAITTTLSVSGLRSGDWAISYFGLADSLRIIAPQSGKTTVTMTIAPYDTRAYLLQSTAITGVSGKRLERKSLPSKRITEGRNAVEVLDPARGLYRNILGRVRIPY